MAYLNCPRCRLTVRLRADALAPAHCPRCAARHGVHEQVFLSPRPSRLLKTPLAGAPGVAGGAVAASRVERAGVG